MQVCHHGVPKPLRKAPRKRKDQIRKVLLRVDACEELLSIHAFEEVFVGRRAHRLEGDPECSVVIGRQLIDQTRA